MKASLVVVPVADRPAMRHVHRHDPQRHRSLDQAADHRLRSGARRRSRREDRTSSIAPRRHRDAVVRRLPTCTAESPHQQRRLVGSVGALVSCRHRTSARPARGTVRASSPGSSSGSTSPPAGAVAALPAASTRGERRLRRASRSARFGRHRPRSVTVAAYPRGRFITPCSACVDPHGFEILCTSAHGNLNALQAVRTVQFLSICPLCWSTCAARERSAADARSRWRCGGHCRRRPTPPAVTVMVGYETFAGVASSPPAPSSRPVASLSFWATRHAVERVVFRVLTASPTSARPQLPTLRRCSSQHPGVRTRLCDVPAHRCQGDHVVAWNRGSLTAENGSGAAAQPLALPSTRGPA
jgi:hypothetical protein